MQKIVTTKEKDNLLADISHLNELLTKKMKEYDIRLSRLEKV